MTNTTAISTADILDGHLPATATGVRWTHVRWTECRDHLLDPSWRQLVERSEHRDGVVLTGPVKCSACAEAKSA